MSYDEHLISMAGGDGDETAREIANRVGRRYAQLHQLVRDELQAKAWDEGWSHYRKYFSPDFPEFGANPYRTKP